MLTEDNKEIKLKSWLKMNWIPVTEQLPDVSLLGDGNVCKVWVKTTSAGSFRCLFGNSGAPSETNSFFTTDHVISWKPLIE